MVGHDMQKCPYAFDFVPAQPSTGDNADGVSVGSSSLKDFTSLKVIGKGTYGRVFRAVRTADNKEYAIKEISIGSMPPKEREDALNEVRVLASLESNPHAIRYYDAFLENDKLFIVTELAKGGDLAAKIKRHLDRKERMEESIIWTYFIQICQGLAALHANKVLHRDIKSANIYLISGKRVKIGDFGVSKVVKTGMATTQIGTPYYMSPEVWQNQRYNDKSDVWALGVVLYEMAALHHPFQAATEAALRDRVLKGAMDPLPPCYSPALREVVRLLLTAEPRARPSVAQLLAHPAVAQRVLAAGLDALVAAAAPHMPHAMLDTIKVPVKFNRKQIQRRLPGPMYDSVPNRPAPSEGALLPLLVPPLAVPRLPPGGAAPAPLPTAGSGSDKLSDMSGMLPAVRGKLSSCLAEHRASAPDLRPKLASDADQDALAAAAAERRMAAAMAYRQRGRRGLDCDLYTPLPGRVG